jgi:ATP-dependent DNA helicase RecG
VTDTATPLRHLLGTTAAVLEKAFGYTTCGDLLTHYPRRYAERSVLTPLDALRVDEYVTVMASVAKVAVKPMRDRRQKMLEVWVTDGSGQLKLTFFRQAWRARDLAVGTRALFAGKVGVFRNERQLTHPDYQLLDTDENTAENTAAHPELLSGLITIYPATKDLPSWNVAKSVQIVLNAVDLGEDPLPAELRTRHGLIGMSEALHWIHRPDDRSQVERAEKRLRYEEAFLLQVVLAQRRALAAMEPTTPRAAREDGLLAAFDARLPFTLTAGQREVSAELFRDLASPEPMHRLLQGEVGSGKTVVALRAMLAVVDSGGQAALLAPTEVLAQQHARSIDTLLGPLGRQGELDADDQATRVALVTGSMSAAARRKTLLDIGVGDAGIVIGTHALLEDTVQFFDLGLVVVDEQHRFGVEQRLSLGDKGAATDVLVMTATPIPRTVLLTQYGEMQVSRLDQKPAGRKPIRTTLHGTGAEAGVIDAVRRALSGGAQLFWVCPLVEESEVLDLAAAQARFEALDRLFPGQVGLAHGRQETALRQQALEAFAAGRTRILVATTVIEVGVDIPSATIMVIEHAERFGLAQLHQLRGRVGRGAAASYCLLLHDDRLGESARRRLALLRDTEDGFLIADEDYRLRGGGELMGRRQSGQAGYRLTSGTDFDRLLRLAWQDAERVLQRDPLLEHPRGQALRLLLALFGRADAVRTLSSG